MDLQTGINLLTLGAGLALVLMSSSLFDPALRKLAWVAISAPTFTTGILIMYLAFYRITGLA